MRAFLVVACAGISYTWIPRAVQPAGPPTPETPVALEQAPAPRPVETLDDLVRTINDNPNMRHRDYTPSVHKLIALGDASIPRMLDLMLSNDRDTRLRAQTVLQDIAVLKHGFVPGRGWPNDASEERYRALWKSLGDLDWNAPREDRERAVKLWREWLAKSKG